jgi:outer membrane protein OmpA-like peptidoglycan-associated protein
MLSRSNGRRSAPFRHAFGAAVALACVAPFAIGGAMAQGTVVIGGSGLPEVEVHLEVLDNLGPMPPQPLRLLPPGTGLGANRVTRLTRPLVPPGRAAGAVPPPPPPPRALYAVPVMPPAPAAAAKPAPAPIPVTPKAPAPTAAAPIPVTPKAPAPTAAAPIPVTAKAPAPTAAAPVPETAKAPKPRVGAPPAAKPKAPRTKTAALPPAKAPDKPATDKMLRFEFTGNSADLPSNATSELRTLAARLLRADSLRVQVKAYASAVEGGPSAARRLSLSRALAVRAFLIDQGVRSTRIDVRALGNRSEGGPPERVDLIVVKS